MFVIIILAFILSVLSLGASIVTEEKAKKARQLVWMENYRNRR